MWTSSRLGHARLAGAVALLLGSAACSLLAETFEIGDAARAPTDAADAARDARRDAPAHDASADVGPRDAGQDAPSPDGGDATVRDAGHGFDARVDASDATLHDATVHDARPSDATVTDGSSRDASDAGLDAFLAPCTSWRVERSGVDASLDTVWAIATGDGGQVVYAAGSTVALRSSGDGRWEQMRSPGPLYALWAGGPDEVVAVEQGAPFLFRVDGDAGWTPDDASTLEGNVDYTSCLWGLRTGDLYACALSAGLSEGEVYDLAPDAAPRGGPIGCNPYGLWGSSASGVYAVCGAQPRDGGIIAVRQGDAGDAAAPGWVAVARAGQVPGGLRSVWGRGAMVYAIGATQEGFYITPLTDGGPVPALNVTGPIGGTPAVWAADTGPFYAVAGSQILATSDGDAGWVSLDAGIMATWSALSGTGPHNVYVVGNEGLILHCGP